MSKFSNRFCNANALRITTSQLIPYCLPLRRPWRSARGVFTHRSGWLVRLDSDEGLIGFGDCAPLPEAGTEMPELAQGQLQARLPLLCGYDPQDALAELDGVGFQTPAAHCALETSLLDLLSGQAGVPLARWLNVRAPLAIKVNAALGALDDEVLGRARSAVNAGFVVLKLKIGLVAPEIELAALRRLAKDLPPGVVLRLDANAAWNRDQTRSFIEGLDGLPVESLEEPLAQPDVAGLRYLQALAPFPLAVDESLGRLGLDVLLASVAVRRLVLKPMVLGGVRPAYVLARRAEAVGMECVVTSTVDSAVGVLAAMHLAAALGNDLAHGVATASWLSRDVGESPRLADDRVCLDNTMSGLGFCLSTFGGR